MVMVTAVAADDVAVAKALAGRLSTRLADKVEFVQKKSAVDQFTMSGRKGKVVITANNANSMAVGLNHYLQNYCLTNVSWYSNVAVELPDQLPDVKKSVTIKARVPQRFFLNYCTFGYTMPFWQWTGRRFLPCESSRPSQSDSRFQLSHSNPYSLTVFYI